MLAAVQLSDKAENYSRTLSGGMRRRLMVAKAMVHKPPVLVLDEPTAGVDVELRQQLWSQIRALNRSGTTILLTTHYLDEAQELCDRIAFIDHGEVIACDTTEALLERVDRKEVTFSLGEPLERAARRAGALQCRNRPAAPADDPLPPEPDALPRPDQRRARGRPDDRRRFDPGKRSRRPVPATDRRAGGRRRRRGPPAAGGRKSGTDRPG